MSSSSLSSSIRTTITTSNEATIGTPPKKIKTKSELKVDGSGGGSMEDQELLIGEFDSKKGFINVNDVIFLKVCISSIE